MLPTLRHRPRRSTLLLVASLACLLACSGSDDKKDKTPKETGPKPPGDSITLKFDWPVQSMFVEIDRVDKQRHPQRGEEKNALKASAKLEVSQGKVAGAYRHVAFADLESPEAKTPEQQAKLLKAQQAVGTLPLPVNVDEDGNVASVASPEPMIVMLVSEVEEQMKASGLPEEKIASTIEALNRKLDPRAITSSTGKLYHQMFTQWSGVKLEKGKPLTMVVEQPLGLGIEEDRPVKFTTTMLYDGAVPCNESSPEPLCVKLSAQITVDEKAAAPIYEAYIRQMVVPTLAGVDATKLEFSLKSFRSISRSELIAQPKTLIPQRFVMDFASNYEVQAVEKKAKNSAKTLSLEGGQENHLELTFTPETSPK